VPIDHATIVSTQGPSSRNRIETQGNIQRRLFAYQVALTQTPGECEPVHQTFRQIDNSTAQQGLRQEKCAPPMPLHGLGEAQGRFSTPDELARQCSRALCPRTPNP
jgi:hypothetical protein